MYLLSFAIPFLVFVLACTAMLITPFGDKHSLAITDAQWYLNGELSFARLLRGQENVLYSFNNGLGGNQWSLLAWGTFNLGNLLALFAKLETIPAWFTWICGVNLALSGLTMYLLLDYVNGHKLSNLIFSTSYAFIGFNVVNVYQTGFVLGPELLPLVVLGLVLLVRGKTPLVYILSLGLITFFDFYFAFHLCVFSVVFLLGHLCVNVRQWDPSARRLTLRWLSASVIGGLLGAPMWLPALKAYSGGGRLNQTGLDEYTFRENMPFIRMFSKLFTGANSTDELVNGLPNIFCGILVLALVILYFMNRRVDLSRRRAAGVVLAFYLLTFFVPAFTILMHGGTHTNWFPYRYSYVFSFVLICLAVEEFRHIEEITIEETKQCGIILVIASILIFSTSYEYMSGTFALLDLSLLLVMWLGFWCYKTKPDKAPLRTVTLLLLIVVCGNLYANFIMSTRNVREWELDLKEYGQNVFVSGALIDALNGAENSFFRMEKEKSESESVGVDAALYNYNGVSHSGPGERMFIHKQLNRLGINWFNMRHWYSEGVPAATDSLLGLKYIISERNLTEEKGYENRISIEGFAIYQSPYFLPLSILSDNGIQGTELSENVFSNLNEVWKGMTGGDRDIFTGQEDVTYSLHTDYSNQSVTSKELRDNSASAITKESSQSSSVSSGENAEEDSNSYILCSFTAERDGPVYVFDTSIPESPNGLVTPSIQYVGSYRTGETVEHRVPLTDGIASGDVMRGYCANLVFAYADNSVLADYAAQLNARDITFNVEHENQLNGTFTAEANQRILFTIPWDEGWTCYIDGQRVPIDKTWDLFMSVEVPEGAHTWEMKFFPAWMDIGLFLSGAALLGLVAIMLFWRKGGMNEDTDISPSGTEEFVVLTAEETATRNDQAEFCGSAELKEAATIADPLGTMSEAVMQREEAPAENHSSAERRIHVKRKSAGTYKGSGILSRSVIIQPSSFFVIVSLLGILAVLLALYISRGTLTNQYFWYDTRDTGMDFFSSIEYLRGNNPYSVFHTLYPPLANLLFNVLYHFVPKELTESWGWDIFENLKLRTSENDPRTYQTLMVAFIVFIIVSVLLSTAAVSAIVEKKSRPMRYALVFSCICSYGMISAYERGNIIVISFALTVIFLLTYDNGNRLISETGMICLALAAGLKLYPAVFGLVLLKEQRWKQAVRTVLYGILAVLLPALFLGDGLPGLRIWLIALTGERTFTFGTQSFDYSAKGILKGVNVLLSLKGMELSNTVISCLSVLMWVAPLLCFFKTESRWKQLFFLTMAVLLFSSQGSYRLIFVLIPLLFLIRTEDRFSNENLVPTVCMVLLAAHLPVFYEPYSGWYRMPFYHIIFLILLVYTACEIVSWRKKLGKGVTAS